jgi:polyhydroxyalkanoate synthesis regulator phasin
MTMNPLAVTFFLQDLLALVGSGLVAGGLLFALLSWLFQPRFDAHIERMVVAAGEAQAEAAQEAQGQRYRAFQAAHDETATKLDELTKLSKQIVKESAVERTQMAAVIARLDGLDTRISNLERG